MLLDDLLDSESIALERLYASNPSAINEDTVKDICKISQKQARACLRAWNHFGYVKTLTHSSGGYGIRKQNVFTDKTKALFDPARERITRRVDAAPLQVITYTKLLEKNIYLNTHEKENPSQEEKKDSTDQKADAAKDKLVTLGLSPYELSQFQDSGKLREQERAAREIESLKRFELRQRRTSKKRRIERYKKARNLWSSAEIAHEFSDRLTNFHISPWEVVKSRFIPALADARRRFNTNGEIEYLMVLKYQEIVDIKKFNTGEKLWKNFIYLFSQLAENVRSQYSSPEALEDQKQFNDRSRAKLKKAVQDLERAKNNVQD